MQVYLKKKGYPQWTHKPNGLSWCCQVEWPLKGGTVSHIFRQIHRKLLIPGIPMVWSLLDSSVFLHPACNIWHRDIVLGGATNGDSTWKSLSYTTHELQTVSKREVWVEYSCNCLMTINQPYSPSIDEWFSWDVVLYHAVPHVQTQASICWQYLPVCLVTSAKDIVMCLPRDIPKSLLPFHLICFGSNHVQSCENHVT